MFKELKRNMLFLNLSILTVLLLIVFSSLYLSSYANIQSTVDKEISFIIGKAKDLIIGNPGPVPNPSDGNVIPERTVSFIIITDLNDTIVATQAQFTTTDAFFQSALDVSNKSEGQFELDGSYWAYQTSDFESYKIYAYVDISTEHDILNNMIIRFAIIFLIGFAAVYVISSFITKRSISKIDEAFTKQRQFISNASHELKTPLAIINTNTDVLLSKVKQPETQKWLDNIKFETDRMNGLTKDLLYLAKVTEQNHSTLDKERLNLSELTESVILSFEALAYEKNITFNYDIEKDINSWMSREHYNQLLHILIDNAIKYNEQNGSVEVHMKTNHNFVHLIVKNTGNGIPKEDIPNVFDRFYMGDKSRSANPNSYGLGLSIAKSIVDGYGGKITCDSVVGSYTSFEVKLKIQDK